jgi:hypothetical protein
MMNGLHHHLGQAGVGWLVVGNPGLVLLRVLSVRDIQKFYP